MKSAQHLLSEPPTPRAQRASSVHIGREDYASILLRLIGMELYKIRRRMMSKVLSIISITATMGLFLLIALAASLTRNGASPEQVRSFTEALRLPTSLALIVQLLITLGQILIIILTSTVVGGEYTSGTIRLMLTRGPTRTQLLFSKLGAAVACIALGAIGVTLLGILTGLILNIPTGIPQSFDFFSAAWFGHLLLCLLVVMLGLSMYAAMALCLSTLGRATAAGIAGVLTWGFLIEPAVEVISSFGRNISGSAGAFFQALPDYLIGTNISLLVQNQERYLFSSSSNLPTPSDLHALLVLAVYLVLFIGLAWWVSIRRDITN